MNSNVVIIKTDKYFYFGEGSFRPSIKYPEYPFDEISTKNENHIYDMVREGFALSEYDIDNFGLSSWNPLSKFVRPGDTVVIKPNLVMDVNPTGDGMDCLITQPSVVAAIVDYVIIALKGRGKIIIGDAPMQECDFDNLIKTYGYERLIKYYIEQMKNTDIDIKLVDFRELRSVVKNDIHYSKISKETKGHVINLADESEFYGKSEDFFDKIRITNYDPMILHKHHNVNKNEYYISNFILSANCIINVPKPKTHRKAGVTASLKNLVGINARKEYLPHHTNGAVVEGGDEYLNESILKSFLDVCYDRKNINEQTRKSYWRAWIWNNCARCIRKFLKKIGKDQFYEGSWYGNDTISRTIVDLNKILLYSDKEGIMCDEKQRRYLTVSDFVISGENEGPVMPTAKNIGMIVIGENPVCIDEAIFTLMGARVDLIPTIKRARGVKGKYKIVRDNDIPFLISNDGRWNNKYINDINPEDIFYFSPASGWVRAFKERKV